MDKVKLNTEAQVIYNAYIRYVSGVLDNIESPELVKASYNTGYGIHLVSEHLGDAPMTLFVVQHSLAKVSPPEITLNYGDVDLWDKCWSKAVEMINEFVKENQ